VTERREGADGSEMSAVTTTRVALGTIADADGQERRYGVTVLPQFRGTAYCGCPDVPFSSRRTLTLLVWLFRYAIAKRHIGVQVAP
jgi:hypothetical protein